MLSVNDLRYRIASNDIPHLIIMDGDNLYFKKAYIDAISSKLDLQIIYCSLDEFYLRNTVNGLFSKTAIYVVIEDFLDLKQVDIKNNYLICYSLGQLDKRSKFYNIFKESIYLFDKISRDQLALTLKPLYKDIHIERVEKLAELLDYNTDHIINELDKLYHLSLEKYGTTLKVNECFNEFYKQLRTTQDIRYLTVNSFLSKDFDNYLKYINLLNKEDSQLYILFLIYNKLRSLLQISYYKNKPDKDISNFTGLDSREIYFNKQYLDNFTVDQLRYCLRLIYKIDKLFKSYRLSDDNILIYFLANYLKET